MDRRMCHRPKAGIKQGIRSGTSCWKAPRTRGVVPLCLDLASLYATDWSFSANWFSFATQAIWQVKDSHSHSFEISIVSPASLQFQILSEKILAGLLWGKFPILDHLSIQTYGFSLVLMPAVLALSTLRILFLKFVFHLVFLPLHKVLQCPHCL